MKEKSFKTMQKLTSVLILFFIAYTINFSIAQDKATVLYADGTLIVNDPVSNRAQSIYKHGTVTKAYEETKGYSYFTEIKDLVNVIEFGSEYNQDFNFGQFQFCQSIDLTLFDATEITKELSFSSLKFLTKIKFGEKFTCENVTDMSGMFNNCNGRIRFE